MLNTDEIRDLRCVAGMIVPASEAYGIPGADDPAIFADIVASLDRDFEAVRAALASFAAMAGGSITGAATDVVKAFQARGGSAPITLARVVMQCYYRDERVVRSLGLQPGPPFPKGRTLEQGDWSLLDPVRARPKMWRDVPPR